MIINPNNPEEVAKGWEYYKKLVSRLKPFELKAIVKKKSVSNNAYLHVCIDLYAIEQGYNKDSAKKFLKENCNFMRGVLDNGDSFLRSCAGLNNLECYDFAQWIRNFASMNIGLYIPTPEEYLKNKYNIDKHISKHKEYL